ncbi:phosphoribosyltransferase family protein [Ichthyobacterium seriolicida]|uniref:Phosphoribosyltransferase n=1 Tax=Ichthyobacterium seriolicida TaxID=242600 RepID=A0A1J1E511_9FLAO|nr:phosphoribosyltransferase family protein [Ichthyobacterium seriolicida]BAV94398.1 phosphoribosyltransferase [Ichthyobacterium seriolicida]
MDSTVVLNHDDIKQKIRRMSFEIFEDNQKEKEISIIGINKNGFVLGSEIVKNLRDISDIKICEYQLFINKKEPLKSAKISGDIQSLRDKSIVIVDDVLDSGRTMMYSIKYFLDVSLKKIKTAVLVDRSHKKFPVQVDFKGLALSTSIQNHVSVIFTEEENKAVLY